jgi:predicted small lipoprotein YifL
MKKLSLLSLALTITLTALVGCGRNSGPPPALPAEKIAAEFNKVFAKAPQMAKELAVGVTSSLEKKDFAGAYQAVQVLIGVPDLTKEQQMTATRAMLTITTLTQAAGAAGDQNAAAALRSLRESR